MKIHEYQAKELLAAAGAPVPRGIVAATAQEAVKKPQPVVKHPTQEKQSVPSTAKAPPVAKPDNSQATTSAGTKVQADPGVTKSDKPTFESEMDVCRKKGLFERGICTEKVKWKYCTVNGVWDNSKAGCERANTF